MITNTKSKAPFRLMTCSFIVGIILSQVMSISFFTSALMMFISMFIFLRTKHMKKGIFLIFMTLGHVWVLSHTTIEKDDISEKARYYRSETKLKGVIISDVEQRPFFNTYKKTFILKIKKIKSPWGYKDVSGRVLVNSFALHDYSYGQVIEITGKLHKPFEFSEESNFSYKNYLQHRGIRYLFSVKKSAEVVHLAQEENMFKGYALKLRNRIKKHINSHLSKNESGIITALLLGDRSEIPKHVKELFVRTGTAHILAISGLHIGVIAGLVFMFVRMLPVDRKIQFFLTCLVLLCFAQLTGLRPSVVRATIMSIIFLFSFVMERKVNTLNSICIAAFILLIINPMNLFEIGFQLSFACVLGIVVFCPIFEQIFNMKDRRGVKKYIQQSLSVSLAVWISIAGLIAYYFNIVTPVTLIANLFIVPLLALLLTLSLGLCLLPAIAFAFAMCLKIVLNLMVAIVFLLDQLPFSYLYFTNISIASVVVYYGIVALVLFLLILKVKKKRGSRRDFLLKGAGTLIDKNLGV